MPLHLFCNPWSDRTASQSQTKISRHCFWKVLYNNSLSSFSCSNLVKIAGTNFIKEKKYCDKKKTCKPAFYSTAVSDQLWKRKLDWFLYNQEPELSLKNTAEFSSQESEQGQGVNCPGVKSLKGLVMLQIDCICFGLLNMCNFPHVMSSGHRKS